MLNVREIGFHNFMFVYVSCISFELNWLGHAGRLLGRLQKVLPFVIVKNKHHNGLSDRLHLRGMNYSGCEQIRWLETTAMSALVYILLHPNCCF